MEITVALPTTGSGASPETIRTVAVEAEIRGWRTVWTVERLLYPDPTVAGASHAREHYRVVFDPLESIAWAAAHTTSLRFGTSVLNALFHPPRRATKWAGVMQIWATPPARFGASERRWYKGNY